MSSGRIFTALFVLRFVAACSSSDDTAGKKADAGDASGGRSDGSGGATSSGGMDASGGESSSGGKAMGAGGAVTCGGQTCGLNDTTSGVQAFPCCAPDDTCGVKIPLSAACLPRNQFGTVNPACAPYEIQGFTYPGCCRADGCGARATYENLGCISNENLGRDHVDCNQSGEPVGDGG